jgi:ABC-type lipoprotein release transport system permease subunit
MWSDLKQDSIYLLVAALLIAVALFAGTVPAIRASRIDGAQALRM